MPSQSLLRINDDVFAVVDHELALLFSGSATYAQPRLIASAFKTRSAGWRLLRFGARDMGYAPTVTAAIDRLVEDAAKHKRAMPLIGDPFTNARRTLKVGGDIGHATALALLSIAIETIDVLTERAS